MRIDDRYNHFVAIVAGDNPTKCMEPYDISKQNSKPLVVFKLSDAHSLKEKDILLHKELLSQKDINNVEKEELEDELKYIKELNDDDYFNLYLTYDYEHNEDGDAITYDNFNGRWLSYSIGKVFSVPFILKDGTTSFSARKKDIDWDRIHLNNQDVYSSAWEVVIEGRPPKNEEERIIYENMKNRTSYFQKFVNKETYVLSSTAFWGYAFVNENEWFELEANMNQYEWMKNFYERFILPLPNDTLLTIFECRRE